MLKSICVFLLTTIFVTLAQHHELYITNVGTVLFSDNLLGKDQWSTDDISLLLARRYFQTILPPPDFFRDFHESNINPLLQYFQHAYTNIRRESPDPITDRIMTKALSDTLGGYLKVWILPVIKLDFYGGTISQDNIVKLYKFYDEIKDYLDTDGEGWWGPDEEKIFNSVKINVAPKITTKTRSLSSPCKDLTYFEETPDSLNIPLPNVNWSNESSTMVLPLKDTSFITLTLPDKNNSLIKYYNTAKACISVRNPALISLFEENFQGWLSNKILPHLNDDQLYLGLANVLTLTNKSLNVHVNFKQRPNLKNILKTHLPMKMPSKKITILLIILFIEIAWCIPALVYLLCVKKKKNNSSNTFLYIDPGKSRYNKMYPVFEENNKHMHIVAEVSTYDVETQRLTPTFNVADANTSGTCPFLIRKSQILSYGEVETQYPSSHYTAAAGTGSKSYLGSKNQFVETIMTDSASTKSSFKTTFNNQICTNMALVTPQFGQNLRCLGQSNNKLATSEVSGKSLIRKKHHIKDSGGNGNKRVIPQKQMEHSKIVKSQKLSVQKKENEQRRIKTVQKPNDSANIDRSIFDSQIPKRQNFALKVTQISKSHTRKTPSQKSKLNEITTHNAPNIKMSCKNPVEKTPVYCNSSSSSEHIADVNNDITTKRIGNVENPELKIHDEKTNIHENNHLSTKSINQVFNEHVSNKAAFNINDPGKSFFEITIDNPAIEICVDMPNINKKNQRRSKIPKPRRNVHELVSKLSGKIQRALSPNKAAKQKSLIPQPKRNTVDDIVLNHDDSKTNADSNSKLNETI